MNKNRSNKFNKTRTNRGGTAPLGWWKIKQHRYDTTNHPVIISKEKCTNKIEVLLSPQEEQILQGISNTVQAIQRDSIRIALYELSLKEVEEAKHLIKYASKESKERGYTSRSKRLSIRLPKEEKLKSDQLKTTYSLTEKETVRLAIIWLGLMVKVESFTLTNSSRISQEELARQWSRTYDKAGSKLKELKAASDEAYENTVYEAEQVRAEEYKRRGEVLERMKWEGAYVGDITVSQIDAYEELENSAIFEKLIEDEERELLQSERERQLERIKLNAPFLTDEEAEDWYVQENKERREKQILYDLIENSSDEELIDYDPFIFILFRTDQSPINSVFADNDEWKRKEAESAEEYFNRAFPSTHIEALKKEAEESKRNQAIEEAEREERKKHRNEQETIKSLKSSIEFETKHIAFLIDERKPERDALQIKESHKRLDGYKQRLKEINRMKIFDHDFQDDLSS